MSQSLVQVWPCHLQCGLGPLSQSVWTSLTVCREDEDDDPDCMLMDMPGTVLDTCQTRVRRIFAKTPYKSGLFHGSEVSSLFQVIELKDV